MHGKIHQTGEYKFFDEVFKFITVELKFLLFLSEKYEIVSHWKVKLTFFYFFMCSLKERNN